MQKSKSAIIHISALFLIQWLSITVIILNASALNASKDSNQGLIMASETGPQDFILLIMSAISLFAVSLLLCSYLQMFFRLRGNRLVFLSKNILYIETVISFIIFSFWIVASVIVLNHFNASSSCQHSSNITTLSDKVMLNDERNLLSSSACDLMNATIILAFITLSSWLIPLCASIYSLLTISDFEINVGSAVHPYEDAKLQMSRTSSANHQHQHQYYQYDPVQYNHNLQYSIMTTIKTEGDENQKVLIISRPEISNGIPSELVEHEKNSLTPIIDTINPLHSQQQQELSYNSMHQHQQQQQQQQQQHPQVPEPVILANKQQHDWIFDFDFEPVNIDLMLPSSSELIKDHDRRQLYYV